VIDLAAGGTTTCAVLANGRVYCWGDNRSLQVGDPSGASHDTPFLIPSDWLNGSFDGVVQVTVGLAHACARKLDGTIWCWGDNAYFQQGHTELSAGKPRKSGSLQGLKTVQAGANFTCGIDDDSVVQCWGSNAHHALGHTQGSEGDVASSPPEGTHVNANPKPVKLAGGDSLRAEALALGEFHACVLTRDAHDIYCWGSNKYGQLGRPPGSDQAVPTKVASVTGATAVRAGVTNSCAMHDSSLKCWGGNANGEMGIGTTQTPVTTPTAFGALSGVTLAGGASLTVNCARKDELYCAGLAIGGSIGDGNSVRLDGSGGQSDPTPVLGLDGKGPLKSAELLTTSGTLHLCARMADNAVVCWGTNENGQLGNGQHGDGANQPKPVRVIGLP
jgi:alpha-tubulin suppressor-like RCC1 family protein